MADANPGISPPNVNPAQLFAVHGEQYVPPFRQNPVHCGPALFDVFHGRCRNERFPSDLEFPVVIRLGISTAWGYLSISQGIQSTGV